jgi:hypothetical protein
MCRIIHTDLKPENVLLSLRPEELEEINRKGCLKDPKHKPSHVLDGTTNFADLALGTSFMQKYGKKAKQAPSKASETESVRASQHGEGELTYADILPEYDSMSKNQKKKARKKFKIALRDANDKLAKEKRNSLNVETAAESVKEDSKPLKSGDKLTAKLLEEDEEKKPKIKRGPKVDESIGIKICDLGNGCWTHHHFSSEI